MTVVHSLQAIAAYPLVEQGSILLQAYSHVQHLPESKEDPVYLHLVSNIFFFDFAMNNSCAKSCDWIPDLPPGAAMAYMAEENMSEEGHFIHHQSGMMENNFCPTAAEASPDSYTGNRFCAPTEDIGLLHIPSIYETMNNPCLDDPPSRVKPFESGWSWPADRGESLCTGNEREARHCEGFDADEDEESTNISEGVPREPLKRLRRQRANDRERRRMKSLNGALNNLKRCIPLPKTKRRVTKLEILRIACNYIQTLWETLNGGNEGHTEPLVARGGNQHHIVNGMSVTQRLSLLSNNLKFNFQL